MGLVVYYDRGLVQIAEELNLFLQPHSCSALSEDFYHGVII
jgi:hypothetical protein